MYKRFMVAALGWALVLPTVASAQESLTLTLLPGAVNFTLVSGNATNGGSLPIAVTTTWFLLPIRTAVTVYGYFTSSSAALVHSAPTNTIDIPSSRIEASVNGGGQAPFSQTLPFGAPNAGRQLAVHPITLLTIIGSRTDTVTLNINLANYTLPADTYTGSLRLRAQVTP